MPSKVKPIPDGYSSLTPYLVVKGAADALEFYKKAFGAKELFRMAHPNGEIGHAEMQIGNSRFMLADEHPKMNIKGPKSFGGTPVSLLLYTEDVDFMTAQAIKAGAKIVKPIEDQFYGDRMGMVVDPFGHQWSVATHIEDVPPQEMAKRAKAAHLHE